MRDQNPTSSRDAEAQRGTEKDFLSDSASLLDNIFYKRAAYGYQDLFVLISYFFQS